MATRPKNTAKNSELEDYLDLLSHNAISIQHTEIWLSDRNGKNARAILKNGAKNLDPVFTPDSKRILFVSDQAQGQSFTLYSISLEGSDLAKVSTPLSSQAGSIRLPRFSSDGKKLAFLHKQMDRSALSDDNRSIANKTDLWWGIWSP